MPASTTRSGSRPDPDGALWFTNHFGNASVGRITTTGTVTNYTDPTIYGPNGITAGPDGALWFTNDGNDSIGRITTTGAVTNYTGIGISDPFGITAGPDGALWFTNDGNDSIGRITTTGTVTNYTGTGIERPVRNHGWAGRGLVVHQLRQRQHRADHHHRHRHQLHRHRHRHPVRNHGRAGRGARGSPTRIHFSIGRITTTGMVTNYTDPSINNPLGITAGPDGALWFTNHGNDSIGRITPIGATVTNVAFLGTLYSPQIVITGSGFGTAPPYPSTRAGCGYSGLDYGDYLSLTDDSDGPDGAWTAGQGSDCIGLVVSAWSNSQIVFGFGNGYGTPTNPMLLLPGDSYSLNAFTTTVTGTVSYFPAATLALSPATGPAASAVVASGSSFSPGENVPVTYDTGLAAPKPTSVVICVGIVGGDGSFTCYGHIPSTAQAGVEGKHKVTAKGFISGFTAKTRFKLT